jgi:predicted ATPase
LLRDVFSRYSGVEVGTEGDSFFVVFTRASDAIAAAVEGQHALAAAQWPGGAEIKVRMGLHTGEPVVIGSDYLGYDVHRASRIASSAHGGQVVVSQATRSVAEPVGSDIGFSDLGEHRLKDLDQPERLYQVTATDLATAFPPLRSLSAVRNNLPAAVSSFVGRERLLERLAGLLDGHRFVTVTGPGGTGKTRLALEAARSLAPRYPDGVWFVELATTTDPALVAETVASTIGLRDITGCQPIQVVAQYAAGKRLLLVLDNFEHLMPAAATVGELASAAAGVTILVTSREVLHLRGERELPVPPMRLPSVTAQAASEVAGIESVRLFIERTRETVPDFELTDDNAAAIAEICRRLDGLPLAIELVVARIKVQSPRELLRRLDRALVLLTSGSRDLPERQRTLRSTIEWSFELLDEAEQALLARLSVFHGRVTMPTIEAVCGDVHANVVGVLSALVDKSLVQHGAGNREAVFWLLETVREFAREQLAYQGLENQCLAAHAQHYRRMAQDAASGIFGPDQVRWLERVAGEHDNVHAAIRWSLEQGDVETAAVIAEGVHAYWWIRGNYGSGRYWLREVLAAGVDDPLLQARLEVAQARLAMQQGAHDEANNALLDAYRTATEHGDELLTARVLSERYALWVKNPACGVEDPAETALAAFRRHGDASAEGELLIRIGACQASAGRLGEAITTFQRALKVLRPTGNVWATAAALNNIGYLTALDGRFPEALPCLHESREIYRVLQTKDGLASVSDSLALVMVGLGDLGEAVVLYEEAVELFREMGNRREMAAVLAHMGRARLERGDPHRAADCLREALEVAVASREHEAEAFALDGIAALLLHRGDAAKAAELFAAADLLRDKEGIPLAKADRMRRDRDLAQLARQGHSEDADALAAARESLVLSDTLIETALAATH